MPDEASQPVESVHVRRRRLRTILRNAREHKQMTQQEVADALDWSNSKVIRIEAGIVPVTVTDVLALAGLFGIVEEREVKQLTTLARESRTPAKKKNYEGLFSKAANDLFANERAANVISKYEPTYVPGYFQTYDYARSVLKALGESEKDIAVMLDARLDRQSLLEADQHPHLNIVLGEAALSRPIGSNKIMREQIDALKELAERPDVDLQVLLFKSGPHRAMGEPFTILEFDDEQLPNQLYLEDANKMSTTREDEDVVGRFSSIFTDLQELATPVADFAKVADTFVEGRFADL